MVRVRDGRWLAPPVSERWMHLCPAALELGKGTSGWCFHGEGRPCTWSLLNRAFLQVPMSQCYGIAKEDRKSRGIATGSTEASSLPGENTPKMNTLCRVSWGQKLVVLVIPPIAQMESCAASLPVGTGARITSALT